MSSASRPLRPRCFFTAFVLAWAVAVFLPSAMIAATGLSPTAEGASLPRRVFEIADEVAPAAKIGFALLLLGLLLAARRALPPGRAATAADLLAPVAAMAATLALLPPAWSRGFGVGLAGARFDPALTAIYLGGAAAAGLTLVRLETRCLARHRRNGRES
jgi:hypothetical protein